MLYNNIQLVDGGLRENIPWRETKKIGADKVISVVFEKDIKKNCCNNIIDVISNSLDIMSHELSNYELEGADFLLKIKSENVSLLDISKIDKMYKLGYNCAKKEIKHIKDKLIA